MKSSCTRGNPITGRRPVKSEEQRQAERQKREARRNERRALDAALRTEMRGGVAKPKAK